MAIEYPGRLVEISADGQLLWEHKTPSLSIMFNVLPNGNVFYPHGSSGTAGAQEVDKDHKLVWSYSSTAMELLGGERLANGNYLLGQGGPALVVELDPAKQVVRSIKIPSANTTAHTVVRHVRRLDNGNILAALEGDNAVREFDATGKMVWEYKMSGPHDAIRLPNGNTLIGGGLSKKVVEVTPEGQIAWQFGAQDGPTLGINNYIGSVQVLKNGNLLVANWLGAGGGTGVHAFEVTRDKKVVWTLNDHKLIKSATTVTALDD